MLNPKSIIQNYKQILKHKIQNRFVICFVFVVCNFVFTAPASAADISLVVSPPRFDIEAKPGETVQKIIKVTNNSDTELILQALPIDFIVSDEIGTPIKVSESASGRFLASPWFTLEKNELVIAPKETVQLVTLIEVPSDALPGGHYTGVFFEPVATKGIKKTVSYTTTQVGSLFGITIAGDIKYDALIQDFGVEKSVYEFGPVQFNATIENLSDTHIRPSASVEVKDMLGRSVGEIKLTEANIFPYKSRDLSGSWETMWGLGRYSATLTATYGPGFVASRTMYFWIMPYRLLAAITVVILIMIVLIIVIRRHIDHRQDTRDSEIDELKRKIVEMENRNR